MSTRDFVFQNAIQCGDLEVLKQIYEEGGTNLIDLPSDVNYCTPLMLACQNGHLEVVKYLLSLGASTNLQDRGGFTALMHGIIGGEIEIVDYLIHQQICPCDLLKLNNDNDCILDISRDQGFEEIEKLLSIELNKLLSNPDAIAALAIKCEMEEREKIEKERRNNEMNNNLNGIFFYCGHGELNNLKTTFTINELNIQDDDGLTPLMIAAKYGKFTIVSYLLQQNASIAIRDYQGRTVLIHAIENGHRRITQYLLIHGANINEKYGKKTLWDLAVEKKTFSYS